MCQKMNNMVVEEVPGRHIFLVKVTVGKALLKVPVGQMVLMEMIVGMELARRKNSEQLCR